MKMMSPQWCHHCDGRGDAAAPCTCAAPRKCGVRGCGADATTGEVTIGGLRVRCDKHRHALECTCPASRHEDWPHTTDCAARAGAAGELRAQARDIHREIPEWPV